MKSVRDTVWCLSVSTLLLSASAPLRAQVLYGSIVGNVRDASDAAVAGARIQVLERNTGATRDSFSDESGNYNIPTLNPGLYEVTAQQQGFRTARQTDVVVTVNNVTRVDVVMQLGAVSESVDVTAASGLLQTDRAEVRAEITSQSLVNLPVSTGRNYQQVFRTVPGFRPPTNSNSVPTNPSRGLTFNVNGVSRRINNTRIDGASVMTFFENNTSIVPTLEAIDVVNVVTNSFDAEQGLAGGAAINVSIKSGTNQIHGSAFEYYSGNKLKAKNFFLPAGQDNPKLVNHEWGGTMGGPIKRDKLFYFGSFEATSDRQFASRFGTVATPAMKRGDLRESPQPIFDPLTGDNTGAARTAFAGNQIPASRVNASMRKLIDLIPDPNLGGLANNYFAAGGYLFDRKRMDAKFNYLPHTKLSTYARVSLLHWDMFNPSMFGPVGGPFISNAGGNQGTGWGTTYSVTGAATYLISSNFIVDAYYGYTSPNTNVEHDRIEENLGRDFLGIPGTNGPRRMDGGWPRFTIDNFSGLGVSDPFMPYYRTDPTAQYVSNFNWTKGSHEVRFGLDFYTGSMNHTQAQGTYGPQGGFNFTGGVTALRGGAAANQFNSWAALLLGMPNQAGKTIQVPEVYRVQGGQYGLYLRDRWAATRKLTLSYGVRWEYFSFPTRGDRGVEVYDAAINKTQICGFGQVPNACGITESKRNFAPRFGIAYRPTDTLVIRAGYGITNDSFPLLDPFRANYPTVLFQTINAPNAFVPYDARGISAGLPAAEIPSLGNGLIDVPLIYAVRTNPRVVPRGYVQSWNLVLQKQFRWGFTGQAGYVASRSTAPLGNLDINAGQVIGAGAAGRPYFQLYGRNTNVNMRTSFGTNTYDSLQATLSRRFSQGLSLNVAYTFSKTIGYIENNDGPQVAALAYMGRNRSPRSFDMPHNLQITNIWELPFGKGKTWANSGALSKLLGGWQVNNVLSFFSGTPFSVTSDAASLNMPGSNQTADQVKPVVAKLGGVGRGEPFYDPDAFARVSQARFGNTGFNILRGPGTKNWDFGLFRAFQVTERFNLQFRGEAFNFTNTPRFANPGNNVANYNPTIADPLRRYGGFMEITSTANNLGRDGIDERQFRLGLRVSW